MQKTTLIDISLGTSTGKTPIMTDMLYYSYEGNFLMECEAEITQCVFLEDNNSPMDGKEPSPSTTTKTIQLALDRTVLHAQGGGQPTDRGIIEMIGDANATKIQVTKVLLDRETKIATHTGTVDATTTSIAVGDKVKVLVDEENRLILSECHTAGHVVDAAMAKCGLLPGMETSKAYHFLDGPFVEYKGNIPLEERGPILEKLKMAFQELLDEDIDTEIQVLDKDKAQQMCDRIKENYFNFSDFGDEPVRLVTVAGWTCPCGGTHIKSTGSLRQRKWGVTGLRCKKGIVKIKYDQNWDSAK